MNLLEAISMFIFQILIYSCVSWIAMATIAGGGFKVSNWGANYRIGFTIFLGQLIMFFNGFI